MKLKLLFFVFFIAANVLFSQTTKSDTVKKGVIIFNGIITASGLPLDSVRIELKTIPDSKSKDAGVQSSLSLKDGSYEIKMMVSGLYESNYYGAISFVKYGYFKKHIELYLHLPKEIKESVFNVNLPLDMISKDKFDSTACGYIGWFKDKKDYALKWINCPPTYHCADISVEWPKIGEKVVLENIFFETNKSELLPNSYEELNKLNDYLIKEKNTSIQISGHTDSIGTEEKTKHFQKPGQKPWLII